MESFKKLIGKRIAERRIAAGLKQRQLADAMNVDQARISLWEHGKVEPKGRNRARLLEVLKCTESDLFGVESPSSPHTMSAELTPGELVKVLKHALATEAVSSQELSNLKEELQTLKKVKEQMAFIISSVPESFYEDYDKAPESLRAVAHYILSGNPDDLSGLNAELKKQVVKLADFLALRQRPSKARA